MHNSVRFSCVWFSDERSTNGISQSERCRCGHRCLCATDGHVQTCVLDLSDCGPIATNDAGIELSNHETIELPKKQNPEISNYRINENSEISKHRNIDWSKIPKYRLIKIPTYRNVIIGLPKYRNFERIWSHGEERYMQHTWYNGCCTSTAVQIIFLASVAHPPLPSPPDASWSLPRSGCVGCLEKPRNIDSSIYRFMETWKYRNMDLSQYRNLEIS